MSADEGDRNSIAEQYVDVLAGEVSMSSKDGQQLRQQAQAAGVADSLDFTWALAGKLKAHKDLPSLIMPENLKQTLEEEKGPKISKVISMEDLEGLAAAGDREKFEDQ